MSDNLSSSSAFLASISHFAYSGSSAPPPKRSARLVNITTPPISLSKSTTKRKAGKDHDTQGKKWKPSDESIGPTKVLLPVPDIMDEELNILFCGINPGETSSRKGHHFARPGNRFWPALYAGGLTERKLLPEEDSTLLDLKIGMTNLVRRPSKEESSITAEEYVEGSLVLLETIARSRPRIVCFVGFGIWTKFETYLIKGAHIPRPRKLNGSKKSVASAAKTKTAFAMLPYKVVHAENTFPVQNDSSSHSESNIKQEENPIPQKNLRDSPSSSLTLETASRRPVFPKVEPADLSSTGLLRMDDDDDDVKIQVGSKGSVRETLFFKMPNTSGLVTHYKPKDFADFIAALKDRLAEYMQGKIDTTDFATIQYPV